MNDGKGLLPIVSPQAGDASLPFNVSAARLSAEATRWIAENREAMDEYNEWYARNGSPLDRFRAF